MRWRLRAARGCLAEAWDRMYRACDPMIRVLVRHGPVPVSSRDDRVQDIWKAVLTGLRQYDPARGPFAPWLAAVAVHVMYEHARAHRQPASLDAGRALQFPGREDNPVDQCEVCLAPKGSPRRCVGFNRASRRQTTGSSVNIGSAARASDRLRRRWVYRKNRSEIVITAR